ncbi:MAG: ATP synthase F0 subunit B [Oligoflexia bacterium]|nr:ATP synthase F0 subunit B [Oligoflexia bacterium]
MDIIKQLGINSTVWIQLGLFLVSYLFLSTFLFRPYLKILELRKKRTTGSVEEASKLAAATDTLVMDYQGKVQSHNHVAAQIYEKLKSEGAREEEKLLNDARTKANSLVQETREKVVRDIKAAKESLKTQAPTLSRSIASRVLGRDLP